MKVTLFTNIKQQICEKRLEKNFLCAIMENITQRLRKVSARKTKQRVDVTAESIHWNLGTQVHSRVAVLNLAVSIDG